MENIGTSEILGSNIEDREALKKEAVLLSQTLEGSKDIEFIKKKLPELFMLLQTGLGITLLKDDDEINNLYRELQKKGCLIRVEKFTKILETLGLDKDLIVGDKMNDSHYANAVIPESDAIGLAFGEARVSGPLKVAMGLGKSLVGFSPDSPDLKVYKIEISKDDIRDTVERRRLCRHVEGKITKNDIRGVVMRIPRRVFPENLFTEEEIKHPGPFIFRGLIIK